MSQKVQMMRLVQLAANHAKVIISMSISEFYDKIWYGLVDGLADLTNLFSYVWKIHFQSTFHFQYMIRPK